MKISGQVVRTHPVHPELVSGTFMCLECQTTITDVEQQFKYAQVKNGNKNVLRFFCSQLLAGIQTAPIGSGFCLTSMPPNLLTFKKFESRKLNKNFLVGAYQGGMLAY